MENQITQKFIDILGPITDDRLYFGNFSLDASFNNDAMFKTPGVVALTDEQRQQVEQLVIDHFKVKKVLWMELPSGLTEDGEQAIVAKTIKLDDEENPTYEGKTAYVYQIMFSPKMYDPKTIHTPVKDGCTFGPLLYNPENFEPSRSITLTFNPTFPQDVDTKEDQDEIMKQTLRDKLEKVLANPEDYMPEAFRGCMLRFAAK
jgi:hypothetical protein